MKEGIRRWRAVSDEEGEDRIFRQLPPGGFDQIGGRLHRPFSPRLVVSSYKEDNLHGSLSSHRVFCPGEEVEDRIYRSQLLPRRDVRPDQLGGRLHRPLAPRPVVSICAEGDHLQGSLPLGRAIVPDGLLHRHLPSRTGPDDEGLVTTVGYRIDDAGRTIKVTTRSRLIRTRVTSRVAAAMERRSWRKFGDAAEDAVASFITTVSHEDIRFPHRPSPGVPTGGTGVYVPPKRSAALMPENRDKVALCVSNLPLDADERDVKELFGPFGRVRRVSVARDTKTGRSKGSAVVNFFHKEHAEAAKKRFKGYAYGRLILQVDWA